MRARLAAIAARLFPLWVALSTRTRTRLRRTFFAVVFYVVGSAPAWAEDSKPTSPEGVGGLFTVPEWGHGGGKTLFEAYSMGRYQVYQDLGWGDVPQKAAAIIYQALTGLALGLTKLAVGLTWWSVELTGGASGTDTIGTAIQSAAGKFNTLLLPSAIMIGGLVAYLRVRRAEDALSQLSTVALAVLLAVGLAESGAAMTSKLNDARTSLANTVNSIGGDSLKASDKPFAYNEGGAIGGSAPQRAQRLQGDAVWRTFAVSPWCETNFGSAAACERYGAQWLAAKNQDARKKVLEGPIKNAEGGESETYKYIKGEKPADRIATSIFHMVIALIGVIVLGGLALMALIPWVLALLLLFVAALFALLLCIPGRPRQIAQDYFTTILGLTVTSALTGGITAGMLLVIQSADQLTGNIGWLPSFLFTLAALLSAWAARSRLERFLTGGSGGGMLGAMAGMAAGRTIARGASKAFGAGGRGIGRFGKAGAGKAAGMAGKAASKAGEAAKGYAATTPAGKAVTAGRSFYQAKSRAVRGAVASGVGGARASVARGRSRVENLQRQTSPKLATSGATKAGAAAAGAAGAAGVGAATRVGAAGAGAVTRGAGVESSQAQPTRRGATKADPAGLPMPVRAGSAPTWERRKDDAASVTRAPGATSKNARPRILPTEGGTGGTGARSRPGASTPAASLSGPRRDRAAARAAAVTRTPDGSRTFRSQSRRSSTAAPATTAAPVVTATRTAGGTRTTGAASTAPRSSATPARPARGSSTQPAPAPRSSSAPAPKSSTSAPRSSSAPAPKSSSAPAPKSSTPASRREAKAETNPFTRRSTPQQKPSAPKARGRFNRKGKK